MKVRLRTRAFETIYAEDGTFTLKRVSKYQRNPDGTIKLKGGRKQRTKIKKQTLQYYLDYVESGKRRTEVIDLYQYPHSTKEDRITIASEAEAKRIEKEDELEFTKSGVLNRFDTSVTVKVYFEQYQRRYNNKDIRKVKGAVSKFFSFLEDVYEQEDFQLSTFNKNHATKFKNYLVRDAGLSGETPLAYFKKVKAIVKEAVIDGYLKRDPFLGVSTSNLRRQTELSKEILTDDELRALYAAECSNEFVRRAFLLACYTGLGLSEIKALKWSQLDLKELRISYNRSKSGVAASFRLHPDALQMVFGLPKDNEHVFGSFKIPSTNGVNKVLKTWVKHAGIEKHITFYCARHTFATRLLREGKNLKLVAELMGHKSTTFTELYAKILEDEADEVVTSIPSIIQSS